MNSKAHVVVLILCSVIYYYKLLQLMFILFLCRVNHNCHTSAAHVYLCPV